MIRRIKNMGALVGIGAGQVATLRLPIGPTYHALHLQCLDAGGTALTRAEMIADIGLIQVLVDGKAKWQATSTFALDLAKYYGDERSFDATNGMYNAGQIPIELEPGFGRLGSSVERELFALGTNDVRELTVSVNVTAVAVLATINVYAEVSDDRRDAGLICQLIQHPKSFAGTGRQQILDMPVTPGSAYLAMHIEDNAGTFTSVKVEKDGVVYLDDVPPLVNTFRLKQLGGRQPQTGYFHADFAVSGGLKDVLSCAGRDDLRVEPVWSVAPTTFNIYSERIMRAKD